MRLQMQLQRNQRGEGCWGGQPQPWQTRNLIKMEQIWLSLTRSNFISQGLSSLDPTKRWSQASRTLGSFLSLSPSLLSSFSHMILLVPVRKLPGSFLQNLLHLSLQKKKIHRHAVRSFRRPPYVSCMHGSSDSWPLRLRIHGAGVSTNVSRCLTNALHLDIQPIPGPQSYRPQPCTLVFIVQDTTVMFCLSVCLSVYLSRKPVCISVCISIYLTFYLSIILSVCLTFSLFIYSILCSVCLSECLSVIVSIHSVCLFVYLMFCLSIFLTFHLSFIWFNCLSTKGLSVCLSN